MEQGPFFRKSIPPWYDSSAACIIIMAVMMVVFLFALCGVSAARQWAAYRDYIWVPVILSVFSMMVFISTLIRWLIRRHLKR